MRVSLRLSKEATPRLNDDNETLDRVSEEHSSSSWRDNREYYAGTVIVTPVTGAAIIELSDDEYEVAHWYSYLAHIALISELNIKIIVI